MKGEGERSTEYKPLRITFKDNLSKLESTFLEFWAVTIVTYPGQEVEQTLIVGTGSKLIKLNDQVLRWQKEIEAAAKRYNLEPALIAAVIEQESGGNPEAIARGEGLPFGQPSPRGRKPPPLRWWEYVTAKDQVVICACTKNWE